MEELIGAILILVIVFSATILPWINMVRINHLRREMDALKGNAKPAPIVASPPVITISQPASPLPPPRIQPQPAKVKPERNFERQFGQRLPVWIGGIALALGGYFLVRYSIENILVNPLLRVTAGGLLGAGLVYAAGWVRTHERFANGLRIAQALSGAGIAVLYLSLFAATRMYELLPSLVGFSGMAGVTALAVVLALRYGAPIALLGMLGGFLTPALLGSTTPSAPLLFLYLYMVFAGLMLVIRRENWWWLSIPTLIGAFAWVMVWLGGNFIPGDSIYLGLFLIAVSATIVATTPRNVKQPQGAAFLQYLGLGGALLLTATIAGFAGFALADWGLFALLALGGLGLSYFNPRQYGFVPFAAMAVNLVMLSLWHTSDTGEYLLVLGGFALLFTGGGYALMTTLTARVLPWAGLAAGAALSYYLMAYYQFHTILHLADVPLLWGMLAVVLAALATYAASEVMDDFKDSTEQPHLLAVYAATATAFVSLALGIELEREFLSVAFAAEMLALAWIYRRLRIPALRHLVMVLALVFGFLLLPQLLLLTQLTVYSIVEAELHLQSTVPLVEWPAFQLGLPAVMFLLSGHLLRRERDGRLVEALEYAALALLATMGYYLMRHAFHVDENVLFVKAGFFERGVISNALFIYGIACFLIGRLWNRRAFSWSGVGLVGAALFRIFYFDMISYNPAFAAQEVAGVPLLNALLLPFGLPLLSATLAARELQCFSLPKAAAVVSGARLLLLFALVTLNVRFFFQGGEMMHDGLTTNAEIYSYSLVWLLLGIGLLFAGTMQKTRMLRVASLVVMILTVSKVFLYDASELEGLYRVFSFLGLGGSLLGLSWFYTRFVFAEGEEIKA